MSFSVYLDKFGVNGLQTKLQPLGNGIYMVKLGKMEVRDSILSEECQFFDGKALIVQAWKLDVDWHNMVQILSTTWCEMSK